MKRFGSCDIKLTLEQKKAYYDKVKMDNFKASCKLEGIDLDKSIRGKIKALLQDSIENEAIEEYVGDEDCFSVGKHYIPNQYFKCPDSGLEMVFKFRIGSGWSVRAAYAEDALKVLQYNKPYRKIPFPKTPKKYEKQEREFYDSLKKLRELDL